MSLELKRKDIKNSYYCVGVAYCDLQHLLNYFNKTGYYAGVYGWRGDVYTFDFIGLDSWAICTGYEPIQNIKINDTEKRKILKHYNEKARNYNIKYNYDYKKIKKQAFKDMETCLKKKQKLYINNIE